MKWQCKVFLRACQQRPRKPTGEVSTKTGQLHVSQIGRMPS